ncbi:putative ribonuclease H-like domain-containing protein [Tanacetum coccineum]
MEYSLNSKAFRVFNSRTRIVEENLHIRFSKSSPNVVGSGPDWLFDIDALTRTMNYEPIVAGTQSNSFIGTKASDNTGQARKETKPVKYYILLPLWTADLSFSQDLKSSLDDRSKPSSDDEKKVDEDPRKECECINQEKENNVNNTNNVNTASNANTVSSTINAARHNLLLLGEKLLLLLKEFDLLKWDQQVVSELPFDPNISIELPFDPNMSALEDYSIFNFSRDDDAVASMNNLDTTIQDERGIMIKNKARLVAQGYTQEEGIDYDEVFALDARIEAIRLFLAYASFKDFVVYQMDEKVLFSMGIEDESCSSPLRLLSKASYRSSNVDLLLQCLYSMNMLAWRSKCVFKNKKDERGIVIRNKARLVAQGYTQEEGIDYDEGFAPGFLYGKIEEEVYVCKPPGFEDPDFPNRGYKLKKQYMDYIQLPKLKAKKSVKLMMEKLFRMELELMLTMVALLSKPTKSDGFEQIVDFLNAHPIRIGVNAGDSKLMLLGITSYCWVKVNAARHNLLLLRLLLDTHNMFWSTAMAKTINGEAQLHARVDGKKIIITKSSIRRDLRLEDVEGVYCLPNSTIFEQLAMMGPKTTAWNEFSSTMASAIICLATNQKFNFLKLIFDSMIRNLDNLSGKFLMYPRFVQVFLDQQLDGVPTHKRRYIAPSHTKKIFGNMRRVGKGFSGRITPLFPTMVVQNQSQLGKGSAIPTDPHHTPTIIQPSTQPQKTQKPRKPKRKVTQVPQPSDPIDDVADEAVHKELGDSLVRAATIASSLEVEQDSGNINKTQSKATPNESSSPGTHSGGSPRCQETMRDTSAQTRFERVSKHSNDSLLARGNTLRSDEDRLKLDELMELCTNLQNRVLDLEETKTTLQKENAT